MVEGVSRKNTRLCYRLIAAVVDLPQRPTSAVPAHLPVTEDLPHARPDVTLTAASRHSGPGTAIILDVDGVLLRFPHEQAEREALAEFSDPVRFTPELYRSEVAGKPRLDGALAAPGLVIWSRETSFTEKHSV